MKETQEAQRDCRGFMILSKTTVDSEILVD